ncbi:L-fucose isomerase [Clostridium algidicarnis DSM 15099]|uniref:FucIase n=1 Tax=Clostridium algidicarnis DSM 15099 TaxID=1121295 RepID=A0A2S6FXK1_9CLOT|nr:L-fucose isomerase [Clostridium algidicarnis DSM 15099]
MSYPKIGIRPTIDGRWGGVREGLEDQTMNMAKAAAKFLEENLLYPDGTKLECVISDTTIGGSYEASKCAEKFSTENVCATLTVTPCWCYGSETMDLDPLTIKAVWGFNGTERPGAVYLAAVMAAYAQKGLPAFSIYGKDVQDLDDTKIPEDVKEKILRFGKCAIAVGVMKNKSYVNLGSVAMGIMGSFCDPEFFQKYLGIRAEWVDMTEILRRINNEIYDNEEYEVAIKWVQENCKEGYELNTEDKRHSTEKKKEEWEFVVKMTLVCKDIMIGNPRLKELGFFEEDMGRNAILGGFQGQRMWTDWLPNGDFTEAILNSSFDWNGKKEPTTLATEIESADFRACKAYGPLYK